MFSKKYKCARCGKEIDNNLEKCPYCGNVIPYTDKSQKEKFSQLKKELTKERKFSPVFIKLYFMLILAYFIKVFYEFFVYLIEIIKK